MLCAKGAFFFTSTRQRNKEQTHWMWLPACWRSNKLWAFDFILLILIYFQQSPAFRNSTALICIGVNVKSCSSRTTFHSRTQSSSICHSVRVSVRERGLPRIRLRGLWCTGCCRRTSPHRWRPGSAAPSRSCRWWRRATPPTGGSCRWSFAWPRPSVVGGRSSAPCLSSFHPRQRRKTVGKNKTLFSLQWIVQQKKSSMSLKLEQMHQSLWRNKMINYHIWCLIIRFLHAIKLNWLKILQGPKQWNYLAEGINLLHH